MSAETIAVLAIVARIDAAIVSYQTEASNTLPDEDYHFNRCLDISHGLMSARHMIQAQFSDIVPSYGNLEVYADDGHITDDDPGYSGAASPF